MSYSDNAVMAKVRAIYGKRLVESDYAKLMQMHSINEIAAYLKKETYYAAVMKEVKEELVHRGQLESTLYRSSLEIYMRLAKYSYKDDLFFQMYLRRNEISQLLVAIRLINARSMDKFIAAFPAYFSRHMSIDLFALAACKSYDDLLDVVKKTQYYPIIAPFRPKTGDVPANIEACERALMHSYFAFALEMIDKRYSGDTAETLRKLVLFQVDLHNIQVIYRMKRYFARTPAEIVANLVDIKARIPRSLLHSLVQAQDVSEFGRLMRGRGGGALASLDFAWPSDMIVCETQKIERRLHEKAFRFSSRPVVVVMCFMALAEIEINNITNIIEGVRYDVPPHEIKSLLAI